MTDTEILGMAEAIARIAHRNQLRKFKNEDYITHPEAVAKLVLSPRAKAVAWLHDVLEDCPAWTAQRLIEAGIPEELVEVVEILTKKEGECYYDAIVRVSENALATQVKLADLTHNLSDLNPLSHKSLRAKYRLARHVLWTAQIFHTADDALPLP